MHAWEMDIGKGCNVSKRRAVHALNILDCGLCLGQDLGLRRHGATRWQAARFGPTAAAAWGNSSEAVWAGVKSRSVGGT